MGYSVDMDIILVVVSGIVIGIILYLLGIVLHAKSKVTGSLLS